MIHERVIYINPNRPETVVADFGSSARRVFSIDSRSMDWDSAQISVLRSMRYGAEPDTFNEITLSSDGITQHDEPTWFRSLHFRVEQTAENVVPNICIAVIAQDIDGVYVAPSTTPTSGTTMPSSPEDGQRFYRTDHSLWYYYDGTRGRWLSDTVYKLYPSSPFNTAADAHLYIAPSFATDGSSGSSYPFDVCLVEGFCTNRNTPFTANIQYVVEGSSTTAFSVSGRYGGDDTLNVVIAANQRINGRVDWLTGTYDDLFVEFTFRRVAT